jgi:hypothetical protein
MPREFTRNLEWDIDAIVAARVAPMCVALVAETQEVFSIIQ